MSMHFYSHAPRGARRMWHHFRFPQVKFLLTRPSRGATNRSGHNSRPRKFLLTRPSRGATTSEKSRTLVSQFLLTRPSRGATSLPVSRIQDIEISTHTPLAGRD